jgi:hypothetical protein
LTSQTATWAAEALPCVDLGRVRGRLAVGLRDGALLALLARGLTCAETALLLCDQVTLVERTGQARLTTRRPPWRCELLLNPVQSAFLVAWLSEIRGYGEPRPLFFDDANRPLTRGGVNAILLRYHRRHRRAA